MKYIFLYIGLILFALLIGFGVWKLERWVNWSISYEDDVKEIVDPLDERIKNLEQVLIDKNDSVYFILVDTSFVGENDKYYKSFCDSLVWLKIGK